MPLLRPTSFSLAALFALGCDGSAVIGPRRDTATPPDDPVVDVLDEASTDMPLAPDTPAVLDVPDVPDVTPDRGPDLVDTAPVDLGVDRAEVEPEEDVPFDSGDVPRDRPLLDIPVTGPVLPKPGRSSGIAVSFDDRVVVSANRSAGSVSVYGLTTGAFPAVLRLAEVPITPADSEPWHVAIGPDGNTAYVILRRAQQVIRLTGLRTGSPVIGATRATTGSEPTSMALSPSGRTLYVSNWGDGTLTVITTATMMVSATIDLNAPLASSGMLGTLTARRGLAHPRAVVMTNNGDGNDDDETLFVTEFYAQRRTSDVPTGLERFDQGHQGVVYRVPTMSRMVTLHTIAPIADMGFRSTDNVVAGCFPNQLYAAAIAQGRVFITGVCASPRGPVGPLVTTAPTDAGVDAGADVPRADVPDVPRTDVPDVPRTDVPDVPDVPGDRGDVPDAGPPIPPLDPEGANFRTEHTGAIFVLDATTGTELTASRVLLNRRWYDHYDTRRVDDTAARRYPLLPIDIDFVPAAIGGTAGSTVAYVAGYGADGVFRVTFTAAGAFASVGATTGASFVDLSAVTAPVLAGRGPYGVAVTHGNNNAVTINEFTRNVSAIELAGQTVTGSAEASVISSAAAQVVRGRQFFVTGLGRWSFKGQAWNSCEACHPDGLSDGITWFFARGPRQTPSLDGTSDAAGAPRIMNWTAVFDEVADFELNVRGNSGGVGAIVHRRNDGAMPPSITNADRIVFDGTAPVAPQRATPEPHNGLSGAIDSIAGPLGSGTVRSVLDEWADLRAYVTAIRTPRAPSGLSAADVTAGRTLFTTHNCNGCHAGPLWTRTARFYTPGPLTTERTMGSLVRTTWTRPMNFPPSVAAAMGGFRLAPFNADDDQILCMIRNVGTWAAGAGVRAPGVDVLEVRTNMSTMSQGSTGFNTPSLLGVAHSAPYFHAGNARTLEEAFLDVFGAHHRAYSASFLTNAATRATELRQMIAFLLSIDGDAMAAPSPATIPLAGGATFEPDLCAQFR